jgi:hypothetical protein
VWRAVRMRTGGARAARHTLSHVAPADNSDSGSAGRYRRREATRRYVDKRIISRARIYVVIFVVTLVVAVVDSVIAGGWTWLVAATGVAGGIGVGVVASRMTRLEWDQFEKRIQGRVDAVGLVVLVAYLAFTIFRSRIVDLWVPATQVAATSMGVLSGAMLGQVVGIRRGLRSLARRLRARVPGEAAAERSAAD